MRKVKLTTAVIRGIIALGRPGMVQAMRGELSQNQMNELSIYRSHIDDADRDWETFHWVLLLRRVVYLL